MRCYWFCNVEGLLHLRIAHTNVEILEVEIRVSITVNLLISLHYLLYLKVDEVVEGVNVLFHKTFDLEEGRQQLPFVLHCGYRSGKVLTVV